MKRQANTGTKATKRTLWRNTLMGIIGLTMSACGISEDGTYERIEHRAADIVSAQADATTLSVSEKEKEIDALKEVEKADARDSGAFEAIRPEPTDVREPPKQRSIMLGLGASLMPTCSQC